MNPRIAPNKIKMLSAISIIVLLLICLFSVGFATAGVVKSVTANLSGFLPLIYSKPADVVPVTSTGVLIVFSSQATTDGNAGGRTGMNQICMSEDPASHFCNLGEIENAWVNKGVSFQSPFIRAWVDHPTLYSLVLYQTERTGITSGWNWGCEGWTNNTSGGATWIDNNAQKLSDDDDTPVLCSEVHPVSCCKSAP